MYEHTEIRRVAGVDVSDRKSQVCWLDRATGELTEAVVPTAPEDFRDYFSGLTPSRVIAEVGSHSQWISEVLLEAGHEVILADPRQLLLISRSRSKTDRKDAELLARLGSGDLKLLTPVVHRRRQTQADRALVHARQRLVESRTKLTNAARGLVKPFGVRLPAGAPATMARHAQEVVPKELLPAIAPLLEAAHSLQTQIKRLDRQIEEIIDERYPIAQQLREVPGVGPISSLFFVLTIEDPSRFAKSRDVGPYLGLVPKKSESGDRDPQLGITRCGDPCMRQLLVQCAHYILSTRGPDTDLKRWGLRLAERGGKRTKKQAVVAVARRLSVLLHRLWVTGEPYKPLKVGDIAEQTAETRTA